MSNCPCRSSLPYTSCCGRFLEKGETPKNPEELMRSRYTAFTQANMEYLEKTMQGKPKEGFDVETTRQWAKDVEWLGLEIVNAPVPSPEEKEGTVEFIARYKENGIDQSLHEISLFSRSHGKWAYVKGNIVPYKSNKIGRNEPCPCGSGKKYKQCCLK